ncbi:MAG: chemotaxis protein CheB [Desulfobacterales bacterium]
MKWIKNTEKRGTKKSRNIPGPQRNGGQNTNRKFYVVGIGVSAGGLEAFESFFEKMPSDPDMAFILAPHLDPGHISLMPELIQKYTPMTVTTVKDAGSGFDYERVRSRQGLEAIPEIKTRKRIASLLNISVKTVDHHRANMMERLNVKNRIELVNYTLCESYHNESELP